MKAIKLQWQHYWQARHAREQRAILLAASVVLPIVAYLLLWQPAQQGSAKLEKNLPQLRQQAATVQLQALEIEKLRRLPQPASLDASMLQSAIESAAQQLNMRPMLNQLEPAGENRVRVTLEQVSFEQWLDLLRQLQQTQQIRTESANITALPQPGVVRVTATLVMGGQP